MVNHNRQHQRAAVNGNGPAAAAVRTANGDQASTDDSEHDDSDVVVTVRNGGELAIVTIADDNNGGDFREPLSPSQGQRSRLQTSTSSATDMRQGFGEYDAEVLRELEARYQLYYTETRHHTVGRAKPLPYSSPPDWRAKDKVKIVQGALVVCLRIGFDPPDVIKTQPCARLEAWVDTAAVGRDRCQEQIALNLSRQFESLALSSKARFQTYMDPAHEDLRKLCVGLRRKARNDRALFHYNGHGVPRPTPSGEIWVFNRQYTQYIPVSVADVVGYLAGSTIYIWDCSNAGNIVNKIVDLQTLEEGKFPSFSATTASSSAQEKQAQANAASASKDEPDRPVSIAAIQDIIQLAACQANETLPMNPDLPADLFTSCITSPIEMSVRFFLLHNPLRAELKADLGLKIPGKLSDRKTPLGELIWIFTSVTDTIAWNTVPRHLFQRLFRHDLVMAAIFRGFLLAERIMRRYNCTPLSVPALPSCANHPLWDSWDLALDRCLAQMPGLIAYDEAKRRAELVGEVPPAPVIYSHSYFFSDHLSAFSVWIDQGTARTIDAAEQFLNSGTTLKTGHKRTLPEVFAKMTVTEGKPRILTNGDTHHTRDGSHDQISGTLVRIAKAAVPITVAGLKRYNKTLRVAAEQPEHLPILLQVLLSQVHRLRALMLLCRFLDLGPWAVNLGLSIGIFPYVLKLLQAPGPELRPVLIYIWARILGIYRLCQEELAKAAGVLTQRAGGKPELPFHYFAGVLDPQQQMLVIPNVSEHRAMCCFILSVFMRDFPLGQQLALTTPPPTAKINVMESCIFHLKDPDQLLRQWSILTIGVMWDDFDEAKGLGIRNKTHSQLTGMLNDDIVEVRAAALCTLGIFVGCTGSDIQSDKSNIARSLGTSDPDRTGLTVQWQEDEELGIAMAVIKAQNDGSPLVRKELVILLSAIVYHYRGSFAIAAYEYSTEQESLTSGMTPQELFDERLAVMEHSLLELDAATGDGELPSYSVEFRSIMFASIYKCLLDLSVDPFPDVADRAGIVIDFIHEHLIQSQLPSAVPDPPPSTSSCGSSASSDSQQKTKTPSVSQSTAATGQSSHLVQAAKEPPMASALRALIRLGLAEPHRSRYPAVSAQLSPARVTALNASALPTSKSVAHFDMRPNSSRGIRQSSSFDNLHCSTSVNPGEYASSPARESATYSEKSHLQVSDAKDLLVSQDVDRRTAMRQFASPFTVAPARVPATVPIAANPAHDPPPWKEYKPNPTVSDEQGRIIRRELPLRSEFFDWSAEYFINPQMKEKESDEPGSIEYNERHWRRERNERIIIDTQLQKEAATTTPWDLAVAELENVNPATGLVFHQFESHIISADANNIIRVFDWQQSRLLSQFPLAPKRDELFAQPFTTSSLRLMNDDDAAVLLVGSSEGSIRLYRNYATAQPQLISAWRALTHMVPTSSEQSGMILEWQQTRGRVLASGNAKEIRIWDSNTELCTMELPTRANSCVTSMTSDQVAGDIVVASFGDGVVRTYDTRLPPKDAMIKCWRGFHRSWVSQVRMQRGGQRELLSASSNGDVCSWDIRYDKPLNVFQAHRDGLTQFALHENAPICATGSDAGSVKVWDIRDSDRPITHFGYSQVRSAYRAENIQSILSLEFHPHMMSLAVGTSDSKLHIHKCHS